MLQNTNKHFKKVAGFRNAFWDIARQGSSIYFVCEIFRKSNWIPGNPHFPEKQFFWLGPVWKVRNKCYQKLLTSTFTNNFMKMSDVPLYPGHSTTSRNESFTKAWV